MLPVISSSFHGRDIFSPIAAHLATGVAVRVGRSDRRRSTALVRLPAVAPDGRARASSRRTIVHVLIFGNVTFAGTPADLEAAIGPLEPGRAPGHRVPGARRCAGRREERTVWERTFGRVPVGSSLLMADSEGHLSLADNQGDAARRLGLTLDRPARIDRSLSPPVRRGHRPMTEVAPAPAPPLVEVEGLTFRYRRATEPAIRDVR